MRSAAGKSLDEEAIRLAVTARVRHAETRYDELLAKDYERLEAREQVEEEVLQVLAKWEGDTNAVFRVLTNRFIKEKELTQNRWCDNILLNERLFRITKLN